MTIRIHGRYLAATAFKEVKREGHTVLQKLESTVAYVPALKRNPKALERMARASMRVVEENGVAV